MTVPAAVLALLQKRSMVGADKPTARISIGGMLEQYDFAPTTTYVIPNGAGTAPAYPSAVKLADGRVLYMYAEGNAIYQTYIDSVNKFITEDDTVSSPSVVMDNITDPRVLVFWAPDDTLYHARVYLQDTATDMARVSIYRCTVGDGSSWVLHSHVHTISDDGSYVNYSTSAQRHPLGIRFLDGDRWALICPSWNVISGALSGSIGISTSDDGGLTWTRRINVAGWNINNFFAGCSRNIGMIGGALCWTYCTAVSLGTRAFYTSTDNGDTWVLAFSTNFVATTDDEVYVVSDSNRLYLLGHNYPESSYGTTRVYATEGVPTAFPPDGASNDEWEYLGVIPLWTRMIFQEAGDTLLGMSGSVGRAIRVLGIDILGLMEIQAKSISISHDSGMVNNLSMSIDNKAGKYSPDTTGDWNKILWPGNQVEVKQGYGDDLATTFTGLIDKIGLRSFPQEVQLSARGMLKRALDQTITDSGGSHVVAYTAETIDDIFVDLCAKAGITTGEVESTTIEMTHTFVWETYGDAFSLLQDVTSFLVTENTDGTVDFKYESTRQPESTESRTLDDDGGTQPWYELDNTPGVLRSEQVWDSTETTRYIRDTDYEVEYSPMRIRRIDGAGIGDGDTVVVKYVYPKHIFREGQDLIRTQMDIDDAGLFYKVICHGVAPDGTVLESELAFGSADFFGILPDKILKIDLHDAGDTQGKVDNVAIRARRNFAKKARIMKFSAVAVPWLEIGDRIQVIESSFFGGSYQEPIYGELVDDAALIYCITDLTFHQSADGFTMDGVCYFAGYAPMPEVV